MDGVKAIYVDDDPVQLDAVSCSLTKIGISDGVGVTNLVDFGEKLQEGAGNYKVAILDGNFLDTPNGKVGFHLVAAYDLAKSSGVKVILILSSEPHDKLYGALGERRPDGIFQKGPTEEGSMGVEKIGEVIRAKLRTMYS